MHHSRVPRLTRPSFYPPRDPNLSSNWRGRVRADQVILDMDQVCMCPLHFFHVLYDLWPLTFWPKVIATLGASRLSWIQNLVTLTLILFNCIKKIPFSASTLLVGWQEGHLACRKFGVSLLLVVTIWLELCTSHSSSCYHHFHHP